MYPVAKCSQSSLIHQAPLENLADAEYNYLIEACLHLLSTHIHQSDQLVSLVNRRSPTNVARGASDVYILSTHTQGSQPPHRMVSAFLRLTQAPVRWSARPIGRLHCRCAAADVADTTRRTRNAGRCQQPRVLLMGTPQSPGAPDAGVFKRTIKYWFVWPLRENAAVYAAFTGCACLASTRRRAGVCRSACPPRPSILLYATCAANPPRLSATTPCAG